MKSSTELSSHDRILRAAKRLFAQNGYENTSTVAIARDAGTSESQLMKHFGSKQGLLVAILERGWSNVGQRCSTINQQSPSDRLLAVLKAITVEFENDPEFKVLAALEARRVRKDSSEIVLTHGWRQYRELIERILADMRNEGLLRGDINLSAVRSAIVGMAEGMWRDQVVADRSGMRPEFGFDDVQSVLEVLIVGLQEPAVQHAKAS
jgi:AcrR family transcriptional regulator